jgi:hypothetical protein
MKLTDLVKTPQAKTYVASIILFSFLLYWNHRNVLNSLQWVHLLIGLCIVLAVLFVLQKLHEYPVWAWLIIALIVCGQVKTLQTIHNAVH